MANFLAQLQSIKSSCDRIIIAVEDVSDLWPVVKTEFEERLPFKRALLNNKTRNAVLVDELPAEYILTTDARLRSRFPHELALFWFREPYATVVLVTCEDLDEFKTILKPRLKLIVQNEEREWFIVFVSRAPAHNDQATKMAKKVYAKLEVEFSSKKRERCCKLDIQGPDANFWEDLESKIMECIRNTLDRRIQFYEEEIRKLSEQRFMPIWNFCNFFILKESLAFMFEIAHLHEDALREYDELELCYLETVNTGKKREFGGMDLGDDQAALLNPGKKALTQIVQDIVTRNGERGPVLRTVRTVPEREGNAVQTVGGIVPVRFRLQMMRRRRRRRRLEKEKEKEKERGKRWKSQINFHYLIHIGEWGLQDI